MQKTQYIDIKIPKVDEPQNYSNSNFLLSPFIKIDNSKNIVVDMQYPTMGFQNSTDNCYLRIEVFRALEFASQLLPDNYSFKILDAWRPYDLQNELYEKYKDEIIKKFQAENFSPEKQSKLISKYVSLPNKNPDNPPVHTTGGAVDLTILNENGEELIMGSNFDEFADNTHTDYFETEESIISKFDKSQIVQIKNNRRLLYNIMIKAGFTNLPSEWWHYDYGDKFWGFYTKKETMYNGVFNENEIIEQLNEDMEK